MWYPVWCLVGAGLSLIFFIRVVEKAGIETLVSSPKTLKWKHIQFSDAKSFPWYNNSFCRAQVKFASVISQLGHQETTCEKAILLVLAGRWTFFLFSLRVIFAFCLKSFLHHQNWIFTSGRWFSSGLGPGPRRTGWETGLLVTCRLFSSPVPSIVRLWVGCATLLSLSPSTLAGSVCSTSCCRSVIGAASAGHLQTSAHLPSAAANLDTGERQRLVRASVEEPRRREGEGASLLFNIIIWR